MAIRAFLFLKYEKNALRGVLPKIQDLHAIKQYAILTGDYDAIVEVEVESTEELYNLVTSMDAIPDIFEINTSVVMKSFEFD